MTGPLLRRTLALVLAAILQPAAACAQADAKDWLTYNHDVLGSRYNQGEKAIRRDNTGRLEEKWRFPTKGSGQEIRAIHATPVIVGGYVYFGTTAATPTFYKLTPDGKVCWSYRNPEIGRGPAQPEARREDKVIQSVRLQLSSDGGVYGSALVNQDTVFFADLRGWIYALDRATGKERWKLSMRGKDFPGAHPLNLSWASPILASGKLIALDAATGDVLKEIGLGPVWSGPSVSRGRVYVGTGNTLTCQLRLSDNRRRLVVKTSG